MMIDRRPQPEDITESGKGKKERRQAVRGDKVKFLFHHFLDVS